MIDDNEPNNIRAFEVASACEPALHPLAGRHGMAMIGLM